MDDRTAGVGDTSGRTGTEDDPRALEIRSEIEETRQEMSETIEAIQEKLKPGNIVSGAASATGERVKHMAYNAADTAEEWFEASGGSGLVNRIRQNPIPAALAGAGLVWLAFSDGKRRSSSYRYDRVGRSDYERGYEYDYRAQRPEYARGEESYSESLPSRLSSSAQGAMSSTRRAARQGQNRLARMMRENPIAVGAAAMVLGAAVGLALPETERENELMGETRDNALEQAQHLAQNTVEKVKEATTDAAVKAVTGGGTSSTDRG